MGIAAEPQNPGMERRDSPRAQTAHQIKYEFFDAHDVKIAEGSAVTINLSGRGALIETTRDLGSAGSLIVWVLTPFYTGAFKGRVVHSQQLTEQLFRAGIQLTDVIEGNWEAMQALIHRAAERHNE